LSRAEGGEEKCGGEGEEAGVEVGGEEEDKEEGKEACGGAVSARLPSQLLYTAMKVLGSEAATAVADAAVPAWTQAERQLANKANSIFNRNVAAIASLIPTRTLAEVAQYLELLLPYADVC
jgi:hypothetical protein